VEYVPYAELTGRPHVIADGASRKSTVLTLSHWPRSGTPWPLKADLSAEIAFRYLDSPELAVDESVDAVSNDHLDLDGFVSVFVLTNPEVARRHRATLIEVARAGDFATTTDERARRLAAAIGAFTDPATSPVDPSVFELQRPLQVAALYTELLRRVPEWLGDLGAIESLWRADEDAFDRAEAAIADGGVAIDDAPEDDLDLAIVTIDPTLQLAGNFRSTLQGWGPIHPLAVHNRTDRLRIVYRSGDRVGLVYRFESWVQLTSRSAQPRVDLSPLAASLNAEEQRVGSSAAWQWAFPRNPNPPVPWLRAEGASGLDGDDVIVRIVDHLRAAPPPDLDIYDPRPYGGASDLLASRSS
jgi:hypothetical protein